MIKHKINDLVSIESLHEDEIPWVTDIDHKDELLANNNATVNNDEYTHKDLLDENHLIITNAMKINGSIYVYSGNSIIFVVPGDQIVNITSFNITIRAGKYEITYSNDGTQVAIYNIVGVKL
jgi:hypothetical protein